MADREHDGSEHAGTRAWDGRHDRDAGTGEVPADQGAAPAPPEQWFGDTDPPPPPYAVDESAVSPPYAVGGRGPSETGPREQQPPQPQRNPQSSAADGSVEDAYPGGPEPGYPYSPAFPRDSSGSVPQGPPPGPGPQDDRQPQRPAAGASGGPRQQPPGDPWQADYPSGPYPAPEPGRQDGPPQPQQRPGGTAPAGGAYPGGPGAGDPYSPAAPYDASGSGTRPEPYSAPGAPGGRPVPPASPGHEERPPGHGWAPPGAAPAPHSPQDPAASDRGPSGPPAPGRGYADGGPERSGNGAPGEPGRDSAGPPGRQPAAPPWSTGASSGFSQWAPPERAPSPGADARTGTGAHPNGTAPRPGESTDVIPPLRDGAAPPPGTREPRASADAGASAGAPAAGGPAAAGPEQDVPAPEQLPPLPPDTAAPQAWGPQRPASAPQPPPGQWGRGQRGPGEPPGPEAAPSGPQSRDAPPPAPGPAHPPGPWQQGGRPRPGPDYDGSYDPYRQPGAGPAGAPAPHPGAPPGPHQPGQPYQPAPGPQSGPQPGFQYSAHFAEGVQPAQQYPGQGGHPETAEDLRAENLVGDKSRGPGKGWRKALHSATFGLINVGESAAEQRRRDLTERARTHVGGGHHRVAVLSLKGGVGKTTTTVALGSMLASLRGDRVLAVDANPDRGTLSDKVRLETAATIRDLLNERGAVSRYADIRGFTSQADSRLEILASDRDPAVSEAFSEEDYREVCRLLEHYYSICLTDCGTGLLHSAMSGVLGLSDQIVLVSSASVDGARSASATLDWLEAHQYGSLVRGAVVVLSMVRTGKSSVDLERLEQHFASRCRAVMRVPWDSHLEEGAEVDLERLAPGTRDAYLQLAATVGEAFAWPR